MSSKGDLIRQLTAIMVAVLMLVAWQASGDALLLFPELGALCVGLLVMDKNVWHVSKLMCLFVMSLASAIGVAAHLYLGSFGIWLTVPATLLVSGLMLVSLRAQLPPALGAALLPVILRIASWRYVAIVALMVLIVLLVQWILELSRARSFQIPMLKPRAEKNEVVGFRRMGILLLCTIPLCAAAWLSGWTYLVAPSVIVTLLEFSHGASGFRNRPWQVLFMLFYGAGASAAFIVICQSLGFGLFWAGILTLLAMVLMFALFRKTYAPALSVALLALLVPAADIWTFPAQVALGSAYAILAASIPGLILNKN